MKEIPNKQTGLGKGLETYAAIIRSALDVPPAQGFKPVIMRARARVDAALDAVGDDQIIHFEDADFATAKEAIENCGWNIRNKELLALYDIFGL